MIKKILGVVATAAIALGANSALAVTINGTIGWGGGDVNYVGSSLATSTGLDFVVQTDNVDVATGDLTALAGSTVTFVDFTFNPSSSIPSFYNVGGLSFDLTSVVSQYVSFGGSEYLLLSGKGLWKLAGFDDTDVNWSMTVNSSGQGTFTAATTSSSVPEPATLGLFGLGLAAVGFVRRRRIAA